MNADLVYSADDVIEACRTLTDAIDPGYVDFVFADPELPIAAERELINIFVNYGSTQVAEWMAVRAAVDRNLAYNLWRFSHRMCILGVRSQSQEHLEAAAVALAVSEEKLDWRDFGSHLGMLTDAASRIGTDAGEMLRQMAIRVNPDRSSVFKPGKITGFSGIRDGDRFIYVR